MIQYLDLDPDPGSRIQDPESMIQIQDPDPEVTHMSSKTAEQLHPNS